MAILDVFKHKEEPKKPDKKETPVKKEKVQTKAKGISKTAYSVLINPHVTEKATELEKENKYVFRVFKDTNKVEVKKAVESLYAVSVESINIINIPKKKRRIRRTREGWRKGFKKAIVELKKGDKIEIMPH